MDSEIESFTHAASWVPSGGTPFFLPRPDQPPPDCGADLVWDPTTKVADAHLQRYLSVARQLGRPQDVALAVLNEHMYDLEAAQQSLSEKADDGGHRPPPKYEDDLVWEAAGD